MSRLSLAHCERAADGSLALVDGCFNQPLRFGTRAETVWGTAYLMMGLSYLRSGHVPGFQEPRLASMSRKASCWSLGS